MLSDHELYDRKIEEKWAKNDQLAQDWDDMTDNIQLELTRAKILLNDSKLSYKERLSNFQYRLADILEMVEEIIEGKKYD